MAVQSGENAGSPPPQKQPAPVLKPPPASATGGGSSPKPTPTKAVAPKATTPTQTVPDQAPKKPVAGSGNDWVQGGQASAGTIRGEMTDFSPNMNIMEWGKNVADFWAGRVSSMIGVPYDGNAHFLGNVKDESNAAGAYWIGGNDIGLNWDYFKGDLNAGVVVHELTHYMLGQGGTSGDELKDSQTLLNKATQPSWLVEGIANWVVDNLGIEASNRQANSAFDPNSGYEGSSAFLSWLDDKYPGAVTMLAQKMYHGEYNNKTTPQKVFGRPWGGLMRDYTLATGKDALLDDSLGINDDIMQKAKDAGMAEDDFNHPYNYAYILGLQTDYQMNSYAWAVADMLARVHKDDPEGSYSYDDYCMDLVSLLSGPEENVQRLEQQAQRQSPVTQGPGGVLENQRQSSIGWQYEQAVGAANDNSPNTNAGMTPGAQQ